MQRIWGKLSLVAVDAILISLAYVTAFVLRLGPRETFEASPTIIRTLPVLLTVSLFVHLRHGLFNAILRYASLDTLIAVVRSVTISVLLSCLILFLLFRLETVPRSIFIIYFMTALLLIGGVRFIVRVRRTGLKPRKGCRRVLLYGVGDTAALVLRGLGISRHLGYSAVGLIDDDPLQKGRHYLGIQVHGTLQILPKLLAEQEVDELWVCRTDVPGADLRRLYELTEGVEISIKILPRLEHALLGRDLGRFQEPDIDDLLKRAPRHLDRDMMRDWISGQRILITGAGGSIGSELARQVAELKPAALALCDSSESSLFAVDRSLSPSSNGRMGVFPYLVDVREPSGVSRMFDEFRPDIVFHAAAYKHVPLVELNPCEGVTTNVQGLHRTAETAVEYGVKHFVFISTDKAVRPVSVMGATKRLGEILMRAFDTEGDTRFTAVRFGNVLGSSGSVVPIFQEQIHQGGPVTVTHPDMTRYFMLVSEAVQLVLQAGSFGRGGEVFILDMGEPVRIAVMASDLIRLMGKKVDDDIEIIFTGPRPGERIHEELLIEAGDGKTPFQDIWIDGDTAEPPERAELEEKLRQMYAAAQEGNAERTLGLLARFVPAFHPSYDATREAVARAETSEIDSSPSKPREPIRHAPTVEDIVTARIQPAAIPRRTGS